MKKQLTERLHILREEYARGQHSLMDLDSARDELGKKLLRISGAIQVLEEELTAAEASGDAGVEAMHLVSAGSKRG